MVTAKLKSGLIPTPIPRPEPAQFLVWPSMAAETPFGCRLELQLERTDNLFLTECPSWFILGLSSPKSHAFRGMAFVQRVTQESLCRINWSISSTACSIPTNKALETTLTDIEFLKPWDLNRSSKLAMEAATALIFRPDRCPRSEVWPTGDFLLLGRILILLSRPTCNSMACAPYQRPPTISKSGSMKRLTSIPMTEADERVCDR